MVRMHISHINQIHYKDSGESVPISVVNYNTDEYILDHTHTHTQSILNTQANKKHDGPTEKTNNRLQKSGFPYKL